MVTGILWAIFAGVALGFYALPEKYAKGFDFENTWGLFFFINLIIVPIVAGFVLINGFTEVMSSIPTDIIIKMSIAGFLWGIGVMMWGKAINYIGLSLGFSIFIGTVILVGSLLPFAVNELPNTNVIITILIGILVVLFGVFANGKAGILRQNDSQNTSGSMGTGILIAVIGGLLATGFSYANAVGRPLIHEACQSLGNPEWVTALAVMIVIYLAGGLFVVPYFIYQLSTKKNWGKFQSGSLVRNLGLTTTMAILNFVAGVAFAFSAFLLGKSGNIVGYAIFNTMSVAIAIVSGIAIGEWNTASSTAKKFLYLGLASMILGVIIIAFGNSLGS